jgi:hypothetical protein
MRTLPIVLAASLFLTPALAFGQELLPPPKELLPAPMEVAPIPPQIVIGPVLPQPTAYYRISAYEHWKHLSPDAFGQYRARVLTTPYGTFYSATGRPYPWANLPSNPVRSPGTVPER